MFTDKLVRITSLNIQETKLKLFRKVGLS